MLQVRHQQPCRRSWCHMLLLRRDKDIGGGGACCVTAPDRGNGPCTLSSANFARTMLVASHSATVASSFLVAHPLFQPHQAAEEDEEPTGAVGHCERVCRPDYRATSC